MNGEKYKSGCKYLGWTAVAIVSLFVILTFFFMILGMVLGLFSGGSSSGSDSSAQVSKSLQQSGQL